MRGSASFAMRMSEWQEIAIDSAKPSAEQSVSRPRRSSLRAQAIEWNRKSSRPHRFRIASNTASSCPGLATSHDAKMDADSSRSEEHTSELQSLMRISYAVFCLKKKNTRTMNYYI